MSIVRCRKDDVGLLVLAGARPMMTVGLETPEGAQGAEEEASGNALIGTAFGVATTLCLFFLAHEADKTRGRLAVDRSELNILSGRISLLSDRINEVEDKLP
jgi:hypothetical protein